MIKINISSYHLIKPTLSLSYHIYLNEIPWTLLSDYKGFSEFGYKKCHNFNPITTNMSVWMCAVYGTIVNTDFKHAYKKSRWGGACLRFSI